MKGKLGAKEMFLGAVAFLLPLAFLPITTEYYETVKVIMLGIVAVVLWVSWGWKSIQEKKLSVKSLYIFAPMLLFLAMIIVSYFFSQDKLLSMFGYYGRFTNTLPFYTVLVAIFVGLVNFIDNPAHFKKLVCGFVLGLDVLGLFVLLQQFGVFGRMFPNVELLQNSSFNMMGTSVLVPLVFILNWVFAGFLLNDMKNKKTVYVGLLSVVLSAFVFVFTAGSPFDGQNWIFYIFAGISLLAMIILNKSVVKERKVYLLTLLVTILLSVVITSVNPFKSALGLDENPYARESILGFGYGWQIFGETLSESPARALFGAGPDTFVEMFSKYKPTEYNSTSLWSVRFSRGAGEYMEMLTNLGLIPVLAFVGLIYFAFKLAFKRKGEDDEYSYINNVFTVVLITALTFGALFVFNSVIWFAVILCFVGFAVIERFRTLQDSQMVLTLNVFKGLDGEKDWLPLTFAIVALVGGIATLMFFGKSYLADVYYNKAIKAAASEDYSGSLDYAIKAVGFEEDRDYIHRQVAFQSLILLETESQKEEPDTDVQMAFMNQVVRETERMLSLSNKNVENWEAASVIYQRLINLTEGQYADHAVESLKAATTLDPNKPQLYEALGLLYARAEQYDVAKQYLEYAVNLQPAYFRLYVSLAEMYEMKGENENAMQILEISKQLLEEGSEIMGLVDEKIEQLASGAEETTDITEELEEDVLTNPATESTTEEEEELETTEPLVETDTTIGDTEEEGDAAEEEAVE